VRCPHTELKPIVAISFAFILAFTFIFEQGEGVMWRLWGVGSVGSGAVCVGFLVWNKWRLIRGNSYVTTSSIWSSLLNIAAVGYESIATYSTNYNPNNTLWYESFPLMKSLFPPSWSCTPSSSKTSMSDSWRCLEEARSCRRLRRSQWWHFDMMVTVVIISGTSDRPWLAFWIPR